MSKARRGQKTGRLQTLLGLLYSVLAGLTLLWEALQEWLDSVKGRSNRPGSSTESSKRAARRQRQRQRQNEAGGAVGGAGTPTSVGGAAGGSSAASAAAPAAAQATATSTTEPKLPLMTTFDSDSEPEDEQERTASGMLPQRWASLAGAAAAGDAGMWEPVRSKKPQRSAGGGAQGSDSRGSGASAPLAQQQQRKRGELRQCDRPDCGAKGRGFRKCGRCGKVAYCTPACLGSDWERHRLQCE